MKIQILCTLGPASLSAEVRRLDQAGVDLFRINLSHTPIDLVEAAIDIVQGVSSKPLCLDLHGAQVRCGNVNPGVVLERGEPIRGRCRRGGDRRRARALQQGSQGPSASTLPVQVDTDSKAIAIGVRRGIQGRGAVVRQFP